MKIEGNIESRQEKKPEIKEFEPENPGVIGIFIAGKKDAPMVSRNSVRAIAGQGLEGDRYFKREGVFSGKPATRENGQKIGDEERQITFISQEGIIHANGMLVAQGLAPFAMDETRRNVVLDIGVNDLNNLVGQRFAVGGISFEGVEKCDPCTRPGKLVEKPLFDKAFANKGGLRAKILSTGELRMGDKFVSAA